jgi:hypothetical protein
MTGSGKIYLRVPEGLVAMAETPYDAEDVLQTLLADYPDLLAGEQIRADAPRRWLLITREAPVPDVQAGLGRWALDHLFVDQDGVPTLVEVKRSSDTRLRREVVGQMLDYAANIVAHWPAGEIRELFERRCTADGIDPNTALRTFLGTGDSAAEGGSDAQPRADRFWEQVSASLAARRLRLLFVADEIPSELQRVIEYLNEEMVRTEVLAVEVKQFTGSGQQTLVPRVIGQTAVAQDTKRSTASRGAFSWDEGSYLMAVGESAGSKVRTINERLIAWMRARGIEPQFGRGRTGPLYLTVDLADGRAIRPFGTGTSGSMEIRFDELKTTDAFSDPSSRLELNNRLNAIPGIGIKDDLAERGTWPSIRVMALAAQDDFDRFTDAFDWVLASVRSTERRPDADQP